MYLRVLILSLIVLLAAVAPASQRVQAQEPDLPEFPVVPEAPGEEGAPLPRDPWAAILIGSPASPGDVTRPLICAVCQPDLVFYHSNSGDDWDIYRLTDDGLNTLANNVTRGNDSHDIQPSYSPENDWVAFTSNRNDNWEIYLAQPDGSRQVRLTHNSGHDVNPVWGPASLIAWESNRDGNWELYMADISGDGLPIRLTDDPANDINPYWVPEVGCYFRPEGGSLVFQSDRVGEGEPEGVHDWEIYLLDVATRELTQLTDNDTEDVVPVLSRDGESLAWLQLSEAGVFDLWFMDLTTRETRQLTDLGVDVAGHTFSPDGRSIAFHARMNGSYNVYLVDVITGQVRAVTDGADNNLAASFRCDNRAVIFHSDAVVDETRPGQRELFEVRLGVTDAPAVRLTKDIEADDIYALADPREEINSKEGRMPPHPESQP